MAVAVVEVLVVVAAVIADNDGGGGGSGISSIPPPLPPPPLPVDIVAPLLLLSSYVSMKSQNKSLYDRNNNFLGEGLFFYAI